MGRRPIDHPYLCECGYETKRKSSMSVHQAVCKQLARQREDILLQEKDVRIRHLEEQLSVKDKQIEQLIKRPRTVNNNRFIVNANVNCFGKESLDHISMSKFQELLRDPESSVARVVAIQREAAENVNVVIPNVRERRWLVIEEDGGEKQWRSRDKVNVLEQLWESGSFLLEGEVDEATAIGARWSAWVDKVRQSQDDRGKIYREQLDMVENCLLDTRRLNEV